MGSLYLLRFDDLCPTMNWAVWDTIESLLIENHIKPLLAVIPDNRDPNLMINSPNKEFWSRVRSWQAMGWTIALHGHQHIYVSHQRGLVGRRALSEFAGLSQVEQRRKLHTAAKIMHQEGIKPTVWVAPGHTFDAETVRLLPEIGINIISDGFSQWPRSDPNEIFWVPQQLWALRPAPPGVWTVCYHINEWDELDIRNFEDDLRQFMENIKSLSEIKSLFINRAGGLWEQHISWGPVNYWFMKARLVLR